MKYTLKAYTIWEQGPRAKQEDSIFPAHGQTQESDRLFVLCDGMGGHDAGEVASQTVCTALSEAVFARCPDAEGPFTDDDFRIALSAAFDELDTQDNGAAKKMGTTLTFLKLHAGGCTIAHIGDSRVYHIRPGQDAADTQILFQTEDHSLVNDLVKIGELTREEAKTSRQKNVITRAMQPCMERRPRADLYHTRDIRPGDYFMLCSDGILEQLEDENIQYIFSERAGDAPKKIDLLVRVTKENHDNHSAILVQITDVIDPLPLEEPAPAPQAAAAQAAQPTPAARPTAPVAAAPAPRPAPHPEPIDAAPARKQPGNALVKCIIYCVIIALLAFAAVYAYRYFHQEGGKTNREEQTDNPNTSNNPNSGTPARINASGANTPGSGSQQHQQQPPQPDQPAVQQHQPAPTAAPAAAEEEPEATPQSQPNNGQQTNLTGRLQSAVQSASGKVGLDDPTEPVVSSDQQAGRDAANAAAQGQQGQQQAAAQAGQVNGEDPNKETGAAAGSTQTSGGDE